MPQLEVTVLHSHDVAGAQEGGADRLYLVVRGPDGSTSPTPAALSSVLHETDLPVRVVLKLSAGHMTTGGEFARLTGLAGEYVELGAEGLAFGFLDSDLEVDTRTCTALAEAVPGVPWTFTRAIDDSLDPRRSWRRLTGLAGLDTVRSAGSPRGLATGYDDLLALVEADPETAALLMPGGGLVAEQVPWFARAGVTRFHIGQQARPTSSYKAHVDAALVRSWRRLLDSVPGGTA
jgi:copper homeostasis protein